MTDHDESGGGLPPEDAAEKKRLKKLGATLSERECDWPKLSAECQEAQAQLAKLERSRDRGLYLSVQKQYQLLCAAYAHPDVMEAIMDAAVGASIRITQATSIALLIVKLYSGNTLEPATASQRAQAMRGAAMKKIKPHELAKHLKKEGIAKLAKHFSESKKSKTSKAESQPAKSENQSTKTDKSDAVSDAMEEVEPFNPKLGWDEGHRDTWDKALRKSRCVSVILKPDGDNSGRVKTIRLLSKSKKRESRHDS
jgi:hypothetical protein